MSPENQRPGSGSRNAEDAYADFLERRKRGEDLDFESFCTDHPGLAAALRVLHSLHGEKTEAPDRDATAPAPGPEALSLSPSAHPRDVGPYRIREVLGEGGMGVVYLAEQREPVRRRVALKLIKLGMDTREVVARFESERQALALMNHPSIAKVYEAGSTEDGRPYFVMEYVPGIQIIEFCDRHRLGLRARLELFQQVCQGVQHAHLKGIIHRDIKPSNILVTEHDGERAPKIIDFGVAKATNQRLTEKTVYTQLGSIVGTPSCMSPEQADLSAEDVDHRTDVYSLGVLLYELLVGELPLDWEALRKSSYDEIRRQIREVEPPPPSTRWSRLSRERTSALATRRRGEPSSLGRELRGDLDWITMKALEKERDRRYATAADLAADIERHLNSEPVLVGPPSHLYRLGKFFRKHRGLVTGVAGVMIVLILGILVSLWMYLEAERARAAYHERLEEVLRLSDVKHLQEYLAEAEELWPAAPGRVSQMEAWLRKTGELRERLDTHRRTLSTLREKALPGSRVAHPRGGELAELRHQKDQVRLDLARVERGEPGEGRDPGRGAKLREAAARLEERIAELEAEVSRQGSWRFLDTRLQWQHDTLTELVDGLEAFFAPDPRTGTVTSVRQRLEFARTVHRESVVKHRAAWDRAILSIRDRGESPRLRGLEIPAQLGLVPLGRDPHSGLWEFGHLESGKLAGRGADGRLVLTEETGLVFVLIPGGVLRMGSVRPSPQFPEGSRNVDPEAQPDEAPVHEIILDPFFLSKYEMTQGQWQRFTGENPSAFLAGTDSHGRRVTRLHPVEQVSWQRCRDVLSRRGLLLPTEAQWEYAARGGTPSPWWTGNERESLAGAANLADVSCMEALGNPDRRYEDWMDDGYPAHAPVGTFRANGFGLHDVAGNVLEWCRDTYGSYGLPWRGQDGERLVWNGRTRVRRGGGWRSTASSCRSARRFQSPPAYRGFNLGVRPARNLERGRTD